MKDFQDFLKETEQKRQEIYQQSIEFPRLEGDSIEKRAQLLAHMMISAMNYSDNQLRLYHEWLSQQLSEQGPSASPQEE